MAKNFIHEGKVLELEAHKSVKSGGLTVIRSIVGVALTNIEKGEKGPVQTEGVFELPFPGAAGVGQEIFVKPDGTLSEDPKDNTFVGAVVRFSVEGSIWVKLG